MIVKYMVHRVGTPKVALPNHWSYWKSEYWNNETGWGHKSTADVFDDMNYNLPMEGEWVEIYVNEVDYSQN